MWAVAAVVLVAGGTSLANVVWRTSHLTTARLLGPFVVGAALAGLALARTQTCRRRAVALGALGALGWVGLQLAVGFDDALVAALAVAVAAGTAALPLRGRADHRLLWLAIAMLVTVGAIELYLLAFGEGRVLRSTRLLGMIAVPVAAGGFVQLLAPYRMIWTCGGGGVVFILLMIDRAVREPGTVEIAVMPLVGTGMFILLGAIGAAIGWRVFRHADPRTPPQAPDLPTATTWNV